MDFVLFGEKPREPRDVGIGEGVSPCDGGREVVGDERFAAGRVGQGADKVVGHVPSVVLQGIDHGAGARGHGVDQQSNALGGRFVAEPGLPGATDVTGNESGPAKGPTAAGSEHPAGEFCTRERRTPGMRPDGEVGPLAFGASVSASSTARACSAGIASVGTRTSRRVTLRTGRRRPRPDRRRRRRWGPQSPHPGWWAFRYQRGSRPGGLGRARPRCRGGQGPDRSAHPGAAWTADRLRPARRGVRSDLRPGRPARTPRGQTRRHLPPRRGAFRATSWRAAH